MRMLALEEALLNRLTDGLLLSDGGDEALVERLGRPRRECGVHFGLLLAPRDFEGLVGEEEGLGRGAEAREVGFDFQDVGCESFVGFQEGVQVLLGGCVGGVKG
jgi:hypothetical protein